MSEENKCIPQCDFCGSSVGEIDDGDEVTEIYYCPKCVANYCNNCSCEKEINGKLVQVCLRCNTILEKISK